MQIFEFFIAEFPEMDEECKQNNLVYIRSYVRVGAADAALIPFNLK